jgi:flavin-dependent dehydrogenase
MSQTDCDVLIVGAGISGAMIAYKAASAGLRVIVLEAGVPFERRQPWIDGYYQNGLAVHERRLRTATIRSGRGLEGSHT